MNNIFSASDYVAVHANPAWQDESNFLIRIYLGENQGKNEWEQLWAKQLAEHRFTLCCIPFFANNIALGDEVETDNYFTVLRVVKASGNFTFRIWFGESRSKDIQAIVLNKLKEMALITERSSENLVAVSANGDEQAKELANYLHQLQITDGISYETGQ